MGDLREEVFGRVFKKGFVYKFYDSDSRSMVMILRVWADRRTMSNLVKEYWNKVVDEGMTFEEFLEEKNIIYEDVDIEGEFEI